MFERFKNAVRNEDCQAQRGLLWLPFIGYIWYGDLIKHMLWQFYT